MGAASPVQVLAFVLGDMDLVRPLGLAGIRCAVAAPPGSPPLYSRFTEVPLAWDEVSTGGEPLVEALVRFGAAQPEPPVLFYEGDAELLLISRHRERLSQVFRFVMADPVLVEDLVDKSRFLALAERLDLPVPVTRRVRPSAEDPMGDLELSFPVVVKPLVRLGAWTAVGGSHKAIGVDTPEALRELWPRLAAAGPEFIVQERVPGPESRIESYHVYVDAQGEIAGEFTGRKIRTLPTSNGHSTSLTISDAADVAEVGRALTRRLGLRGVAKFDFKRAPDGRLRLLEVNPRFNLWHHLGAVAGVNLPALVYSDLVGSPRPEVRPARAGVCWCGLADDWRSARESGIRLSRWLPWALHCEAKSRVAWDDPLPFLRPKLARVVAASAARRALQGHRAGEGLGS